MANTGRSAETVNLKTKQVNDLNILLSASVAEPVCFVTGSGFFRLRLWLQFQSKVPVPYAFNYIQKKLKQLTLFTRKNSFIFKD